MNATTLSLAYSTDLDDAFMFWALNSGRLDARRFGFDEVTHERADTATLNAWAREGRRDVVAVSVATLPSIAAQYLLLPHGGSVGRGYGPVVVARRELGVDGARVGVPGEGTTCAVLVALAAPGARRVVVPSAPMERAFAAIDDGTVDACALIHEGRLLYERRGYRLLLDLGRFWRERRGLPLPLGANVIRRGLGADAIARASAMLGQSIRIALDERSTALDELCAARSDLSRAQADEYLALYANNDTLAYDADSRRAIDVLLADGAEAGLLPRARIEDAP
jgi:1,4-dihydroxy-6-naphthoate synthase